jgi:hypothetical protein
MLKITFHLQIKTNDWALMNCENDCLREERDRNRNRNAEIYIKLCGRIKFFTIPNFLRRK